MDKYRESSESYYCVHKNPSFYKILCDVCLQVSVREKMRQRLSETSEKYACLQHNSVSVGGEWSCVCVNESSKKNTVGLLSSSLEDKGIFLRHMPIAYYADCRQH